jgi:hypothetical protein
MVSYKDLFINLVNDYKSNFPYIQEKVDEKYLGYYDGDRENGFTDLNLHVDRLNPNTILKKFELFDKKHSKKIDMFVVFTHNKSNNIKTYKIKFMTYIRVLDSGTYINDVPVEHRSFYNNNYTYYYNSNNISLPNFLNHSSHYHNSIYKKEYINMGIFLNNPNDFEIV